MGETEVRREIEDLKAELLAIRKELSIRFSLYKEDAFTGIKITVLVLGALYGLKFALKFLRAILALILRHKLSFTLVGAFCYLAYREYAATRTNEA